MAITYCDGSRSDFTSAKNYTIDNLVEMFELSATDATNVKTWKTLKAKSDRTQEEEITFQNLTEALAQKIVTSEDWNKLCDCMINLQKMYKDKGLNEIDGTIENYVTEYAKSDINAKLGTIINELLLTNATKVIISSSTPTVENGALWIKPRT